MGRGWGRGGGGGDRIATICNCLRFKLKCKGFIVFQNLKNYDFHLIMQELCKFDFKINVIPNRLEKYLNLSIKKLTFIESSEFLSSSLDSLVENLGEDDLSI